MTNLGMGVMINMIFKGNKETIEAHNAAKNKKIAKIEFNEERLLLFFEDKTGIKIWDDGQSCCEHRYMTCDDALETFVGALFIEAELRDGTTTEDEYGEPHDIEFLLVNTDKGTFTVETHNEHNGYYGGFWIVIETINW